MQGYDRIQGWPSESFISGPGRPGELRFACVECVLLGWTGRRKTDQHAGKSARAAEGGQEGRARGRMLAGGGFDCLRISVGSNNAIVIYDRIRMNELNFPIFRDMCEEAKIELG